MRNLIAALIIALTVASGLLVALPMFGNMVAASAAPHGLGPSSAAISFPRHGGLDCNGYSTVQAALDANLECVQPVGPNGKFIDNGYYVGHDEPTVNFFSSAKGSGNNMTYEFILPKDPTSSKGFKSYENYVTFWVGMSLCDSESYPQNPCLPDSNLNTGMGIYSSDAGAAFLELQFYEPGWPTFLNVSCSLTKWCAALNIDSLECTFQFAYCNPQCTEPVNFAFLTTNGVPIGPPSPQHQDLKSYDIPANPSVLYMNSGDKILANIHDTPNGLETHIKDLTTGKSAFMVASASNGFMQTNIANCQGSPYNFHPEYSTAGPNNLLPWGADQNNIALDVEIGHYQVFDHDSDDAFCSTPPGQAKVACLGTDYDFDGYSYTQRAWPSTASATAMNAMPVTFLSLTPGKIGPQSNGKSYPIFQFATEPGATLGSPPDNACNTLVANSCSVDNLDFLRTFAGFYPYYSTKGCTIVFGNVHGPGIKSYGGLAEWGPTIITYQGSTETYITNAQNFKNTC